MTVKDTAYGKYAIISIHTPAKGVTFYRWVLIDIFMISIHPPAKGVTKRFS